MDVFETLKALGKNSIVMDIAGDLGENYAPCSSHFGGKPDVPDNFEWLRYQCHDFDYEFQERPLTFLLQINCADLAQFDEEKLLPTHGLLSFFYEIDAQPWGFDPEHRGGLKVYYFEDLSVLHRAEFPEDMEGFSRMPALDIKFHTERSYPCLVDFKQITAGEEFDYPDYESAYLQLNGEDTDYCSKLLGWPNLIQNTMFYQCELVSQGFYVGTSERFGKIPKERRAAAEDAYKRWCLLLQLDLVESGDFELLFGDSGRLYICIKQDDLASRSFDKAWGILQCY